jgi:L-asparaginase / beta-aspartyl-peptidase
MTRTRAAAALLLIAACAPAPLSGPAADAGPPVGARWGLVVHGGAGGMTRAGLGPEREAAYHAALAEVLRAGHAVLERGGSSLDAVETVIRLMEDDSLFNAGRGAVVTADGRFELDASIMDGATLAAGAVAGVRTVRHPVSLARAVMTRSPHVMMIGEGAHTFAVEQGMETVDEAWFWTAARRAQWERMRQQQGATRADEEERRMGTVGAVALDRGGNLAAGTSTGGMMMKRWGRVGDVPVIGAGTYADNRSCAVSATGHGEFFIRNTVARSICALVEYGGLSLEAAADSIVMRQLVTQRGEGGIIAMDREGNWAMTFNSSAMFRGRVGADGRPRTEIFRD